MRGAEKLHPDVVYLSGVVDDITVEAAFQYNTDFNSEAFRSFANNLHTLDGGTHETAFKKALNKVVNDFVKTYLTTEETPVYGGYAVSCDDHKSMHSNLRYCYEMAAAEGHKVENRAKNPNRDFHTSNFLVKRSLFLQHPLDERFRNYGYEDVFWGKQLSEAGITIHHIANPVAFDRFETNERFLDKTEEGLQTLSQFRHELRGYSRMLTFVEGIHIPLIVSLIRLTHRLFGTLIRRNLCGHHPNLRLLGLYKLGYFLTLQR